MSKVTYVFAKNRKKFLIENNYEAKEFFYGATEFKNNNYDIEVIEFDENNKNYFFKFTDRILSRFLSLPFYSEKICTIKNLRILLKSEKIYLVNEGVGCSLIPLLLLVKLFKSINVYIFVMGLYSKNLKYQRLKFLHNFVIKLLVFLCSEIFFLGEGEFQKGKQFHKFTKKLKLTNFTVDYQFWKSETNCLENEQILFIGNDGNKNYDLLIDIAKNLPEYKFVFVSSNKNLLDLKLKNVMVVKGEWGNNFLTDSELKKVYEKSKISILPLNDTFQPSGQSVALQSMAVGVPVIISKTKGFWDKNNFKNNKNIIFVDKNSTIDWINTISKYYKDIDTLNEIALNSKKIIKEVYDINYFYKKIL